MKCKEDKKVKRVFKKRNFRIPFFNDFCMLRLNNSLKFYRVILNLIVLMYNS